MAPILITPEEFAEKHARRLKQSVEDIRLGVSRVTVAPTSLAAAKQDKMLARLQASVTSGKWAARLRAVTVEQWKMATIDKGLNRIAAGIDAAHDKQVVFAGQLLSYENTLLTTIEKMPDLTIEDSVSRATAWIRGMSKFVAK